VLQVVQERQAFKVLSVYKQQARKDHKVHKEQLVHKVLWV
jgi:hypothetical protein